MASDTGRNREAEVEADRGGQSHATWQNPLCQQLLSLKEAMAPSCRQGCSFSELALGRTQRQAGHLTLPTRRDSEAGSKPSRELQTATASTHHRREHSLTVATRDCETQQARLGPAGQLVPSALSKVAEGGRSSNPASAFDLFRASVLREKEVKFKKHSQTMCRLYKELPTNSKPLQCSSSPVRKEANTPEVSSCPLVCWTAVSVRGGGGV